MLKKKLKRTHYILCAESVGGIINVSSGSIKVKVIFFGLDSSSSDMSGSSSFMLHQHRLADLDVDINMMDRSNCNQDDNGASGQADSGGNSDQPIYSCCGAAQVIKTLVSFLLVVGAYGSECAQDEETFLLTCKVLVRLISASENGLSLIT